MVSCYNYEELARLLATVKKPWGRVLTRAGDGLKITVGKGPFSLELQPSKWLLSEKARYRLATIEWLGPIPPHFELKDLDRLQQEIGLSGQSRQIFVNRLQSESKAIQREVRDLGYWVGWRNALLEYETVPPPRMPQDLEHVAIQLQADYEQAIFECHENLQQAVYRSRAVLGLALRSAGNAVVSLFSSRGCRYSANIMLLGGVGSALVDSDPTFTEKGHEADAVWRELTRIDGRLTVVAETEGANHRGFWVPVVRGQNGEELPGATAAYTNMVGSSVFKHDLPPLVGFPRAVQNLWQAHMDLKFRDTLFVSLPLRLPIYGSASVQAVLNVNADASVGDGWERAAHREWLEVARDRVAPFLEIAFKALVFLNDASDRKMFPELPKNSGGWGQLRGAVRRMLESGKNAQ